MSADNRICIMFFPRYDSQQWAVWHGSASCEYDSPPFNSELFNTEEEATAAAAAMANITTVLEYGIETISVEEQRAALEWVIKDAQDRLKNLNEHGQQFLAGQEAGQKERLDGKIKVVSLVKTCRACPSQWEGKTDTGLCVYARYRWGWLTVRTGKTPNDAVGGCVIHRAKAGDDLDGYMATEELTEATKDEIEWAVK